MTPETKGYVLLAVIKLVAVFGTVLLAVAVATWVERRGAGFIQNRLGPNRVGPQGLLQPVADGIKNFIKEETMPAQADRTLFVLAPGISFVTAFLLFAVVPFAAPLPIAFDFALPALGRFVYHGALPMVVADLPIGVLFIISISSLGVYGIVLAGWSQGNKYALLGGLRSSSQMISYEIALGMSLITVLILAGDVTLSQVVRAQQQSVWFVIPLTLAFVFFAIAALAENNRLPFDLPEAESELIGGYHTEYSAMKFAIFFMSEYGALITMSALMTTLFFGGWDIPFTTWDETEPSLLKSLATLAVFGAKVSFFVFWYVWVRWTLPRFRFDQLMTLGWKVMLPVIVLYIMLIATTVWALEAAGVGFGWRYGLIVGAVNLVAVVAVFRLLDRDRLIPGAGPRRGGA
jgi:NADH-quinone oxidoreductase subunit H